MLVSPYACRMRERSQSPVATHALAGLVTSIDDILHRPYRWFVEQRAPLSCPCVVHCISQVYTRFQVTRGTYHCCVRKSKVRYALVFVKKRSLHFRTRWCVLCRLSLPEEIQSSTPSTTRYEYEYEYDVTSFSHCTIDLLWFIVYNQGFFQVRVRTVVEADNE